MEPEDEAQPPEEPQPIDAPPLFVDETQARSDDEWSSRQVRPAETAQPLADSHASETADEPAAAPDEGGRSFSLPPLTGRIAAITTGAVVGLVLTFATYLTMAGCELVRGTSSCGRPGFFLVLALLALMVLLGAVLLRAWGVTDPGSTSLLAVGVLVVVVLVVLIDVVFSAWMFIIVPLVSVGSYWLSYWVTSRFVDETTPRRPDREPDQIDVR